MKQYMQTVLHLQTISVKQMHKLQLTNISGIFLSNSCLCNFSNSHNSATLKAT